MPWCRSLSSEVWGAGAGVPDDAGFLHGNLGVLHQLGQVLLADPVLQLDVNLVPGGAGS